MNNFKYTLYNIDDIPENEITKEDRKYKQMLESKERVVEQIIFDISRYGDYKKTITFREPKTFMGAVRHVEKWLSKPATKDYFDRISDDSFFDTWEECVSNYADANGNITRGDLLGDACILSKIKKLDSGCYVIVTDS